MAGFQASPEVPFGFTVVGLLGIDLDASRLIAQILYLVHAVAFGDCLGMRSQSTTVQADGHRRRDVRDRAATALGLSFTTLHVSR